MKTLTLDNSKTKEKNSNSNSKSLIPGLPDEIAERCLLHLPYPYQAQARSVSSSWNRAITDPNFLLSKKTLSLSLPYIFIFAFHKSTAKLQWQAFDPQSRRWFILPPIPIPKPVYPPGFACASVPRRGSLYVLGGMKSDTETPLQTVVNYSISTNRWSLSSPMMKPRSFFVAGSIAGEIIVAGGTGELMETISTVECYDPETDTWSPAAKMRSPLARYDATVVGKKMYVTEGWVWPFNLTPRGGVYDREKDTWKEMSVGMREGWTGISVVLWDRVFVILEHGDCRVKVYVEERDEWEFVGGERFPCEVMKKPFVVSGVEGRIYVVVSGLDLVVGKVDFEEKREGEEKWWVEWEVVRAPKAFHDFVPFNSQVLYA